MQKIVPHLWFDTEASDAAQFYTGIFKNSSIQSATTLDGTPSGKVGLLTIELDGQEFMLISAGPYFKFTPAISFLVACNTKEEVDYLWDNLGELGKVMMPLKTYPFSEHYGWVEDRYGLSWQLMYRGEKKSAQKIIPTLMFTGVQRGRAEEALRFYTSIFHDSAIADITRYEPQAEPNAENAVMHASFALDNLEFAAMDNAYQNSFSFNEAISFVVSCDSQEEVDYYWDALSAHPESEQCGWLKDKYGVSWQIVPSIMATMMSEKNPKQLSRVTAAFLKMKKFDIAALKRAALTDDEQN